MGNRTLLMRVGIGVAVVAVVVIGLIGSGALNTNNLSLSAVNYQGLSVTQGFNFNTGQQDSVGFVTVLSVGGQAYTADFTVKDPTDPTKTLAVVAVLSNESWTGGIADPINLQGLISTANRVKLTAWLHASQTNLAVTFNFVVYSYDVVAHTYFKAVYTDAATLLANAAKVGTQVQMTVGNLPASDVKSPTNFAFTGSFLPQTVAQTINNYVTPSQKLIKRWGA